MKSSATPSLHFTLSLLVAATLMLASGYSQSPQDEPVPVIIKFKERPGIQEQKLVNDAGGRVKRTYRLIPAMAADLAPSAIQALRNNPRVELIEEDQIQYAINTPNDPLFTNMWGLENTGQSGGTPGADISATQAWDVTTNSGLGNSAAIVAIVDTGAEIAPGLFGTAQTHADLAANLWVNSGEIAGNGVDDDGNGFVDDIHGWNFYDNASWLYYSADEDFHGTHVAGTIGAVGNNALGVTGINWEARIMVLKFIGPGGSGYTSDAIAAIDYAAAEGADVINASWGGGGYSQTLKDAIDACDCVFAAAAGNGGYDQIGDDTDSQPHYPSAYSSPNIIAVAATDRNDNRASFSNYGAASVDLGAPGVSILSTYPGSAYQSFSGTSMATPHVAGVASLVYGMYPNATPDQVKQSILSSVDPVASMSGITVTGGRLNAYEAVLAELTEPPPPPPPPPAGPDFASSDFSSSSSNVSGNYTDTQSQDDVYESITERDSGGRPTNRHDYAEHIWTVDLTNGNYVVNVDAHRTDGGDADSSFLFQWSNSASGPWTTMFAVSATSDTDSYLSYALPSGDRTVYILARDDNRTQGQRSYDTLHVDHLYVDGGDGGGGDPPPPPPEDTTAPVISEVTSFKLHPKNGRFAISWTTNEPATSDILIDSSLFLDTDGVMVTDHYREFKGMSGALYLFWVESVDAAGNNSGASGPYLHQN